MNKPKDRSYTELNALTPEAFTHPDNFITPFDRPDYAVEQYTKGLAESGEAESIHITACSTWSARHSDGVGTACEGIGYHANTADLLRGFLDGPAPVIVHRFDGAEVEIKPRTGPKVSA